MDYLLGVAAGLLVVLSMAMNSALGQGIGVFRATAVNYTAGLAGAGLLAVTWGLAPWPAEAAVPWWAWTGGLLGVGIVVSANTILPKIPVVSAASLLILGQLGTGVLIDTIARGAIDGWQLAGAALVLAGSILASHNRRPGRA